MADGKRTGRTSIVLWVIAFLLMGGSAVYQRLTGPSHPKRGSIMVDGRAYRYRLIRNEETVRPARITVPSPDGKVTGTLHWRRYPTAEPFAAVPMTVDDGAGEDRVLFGELPIQPAAGKVEYYLELATPAGPLRVPAVADDRVILRYKGPVPGYFLWPHVVCMFLAVMIGLRAGLAAAFQPAAMWRWAWVAFLGMSVGGLVLGPIVQKHAFGAYWTGFPFGHDLTDNKVLIMWGVWLVVCLAGAGLRWGQRGAGRLAVLLASLVMAGVYLVPHSMRGSELDYDRLEKVEHPTDAIRTGR